MKSETNISNKGLVRMLKQVHLGGLVEQCVLSFNDGTVSTQCVDMANSMFISARAKTDVSDKLKIGINHLGTLCKYLEDGGEEATCIIKEKVLLAKRKSFGQMKFTLLDPEQVPNNVDDDDATNKITKGLELSCALSEEVIKAFAYNMGLAKSGGVIFEVNDNSLHLKSNKTENIQFNIPIGEVKTSEEISIEVLGEHLAKVFDIVSSDKEVTIHFGAEKPVVIKSKNTVWAFTPIRQA